MKTKTSSLGKLICQLNRSINVRFSGITKRLLMKPVNHDDPFQDPIYFIATVLDPKFRFRWLPLMGQSQSIQSKVKRTLLDLMLDECENNVDIQVDQSSPSPSPSTLSGHANNNNDQSVIRKHQRSLR
jgi:hypothetical protein